MNVNRAATSPGPIAGVPDYLDRFNNAEGLAELGFKPVNPCNIAPVACGISTLEG